MERIYLFIGRSINAVANSIVYVIRMYSLYSQRSTSRLRPHRWKLPYDFVTSWQLLRPMKLTIAGALFERDIPQSEQTPMTARILQGSLLIVRRLADGFLPAPFQYEPPLSSEMALQYIQSIARSSEVAVNESSLSRCLSQSCLMALYPPDNDGWTRFPLADPTLRSYRRPGFLQPATAVQCGTDGEFIQIEQGGRRLLPTSDAWTREGLAAVGLAVSHDVIFLQHYFVHSIAAILRLATSSLWGETDHPIQRLVAAFTIETVHLRTIGTRFFLARGSSTVEALPITKDGLEKWIDLAIDRFRVHRVAQSLRKHSGSAAFAQTVDAFVQEWLVVNAVAPIDLKNLSTRFYQIFARIRPTDDGSTTSLLQDVLVISIVGHECIGTVSTEAMLDPSRFPRYVFEGRSHGRITIGNFAQLLNVHEEPGTLLSDPRLLQYCRSASERILLQTFQRTVATLPVSHGLQPSKAGAGISR